MTRHFFIYLALLTVSVTGLFYLAELSMITFEPHFTWWLLPVLFFAVSAAGHSLMVHSIRSKPDQFMIWFLLATTVKMLLYLALLLAWYLLSGQKLTTSFIQAFAVLYVLITALDLVIIMNISRKQK